VQFGLPQQVLAPLREQVAAGHDSAHVIRDGVELPDEGRIEFVDNSINRTTATFESRAEFANANEALWPGMIVEIVIRLGEDVGVTTIPEIAVQHGPTGDFVFVIDNAKAHRQPVTVRRFGEGLAIISDGLTGAEQVAIDGMLSLSEGTPVDVPEAKAAATAAPAESAPK
jgi:multidrug efflux system membrane fusion protein